MREIPKNLDWVKARSSCSLKAVFDSLSQIIANDVKSVQALNRPGVSFDLSKSSDDQITVTRTVDSDGETETVSVVFELRATDIVAVLPHKSKTLFYAHAVLDEAGECLIEIEGDPDLKRPWQVSQKALDDLFFGL